MTNKKKDFFHITKSGDEIALADLEDEHLRNIIHLIQRKAKEGILIRHGGGFFADDIWYDEYILYGEEALEKMSYSNYILEQKRRQHERDRN